MTLESSAGKALQFRSLSAREEISRLFECQVLAISDRSTISADDLLGTTAGVSVEVDNQGAKRWFHGVVAAFGIDGIDGRHFRYRLVLRPWLWLATRSSNVRIFQEKTTPDIVKEVLKAYPGTVSDKLKSSYQPRPYCVQYRESDFNFVSRLLEEEGIFFYFLHSQGKHELVLADDSGVHQVQPGFADIPYDEDEAHRVGQPALSAWRMHHEIQTGAVVLRDYNYETPSTDLTSAVSRSSRRHGEAGHEVYDYPGRYAEKGSGDALAAVRLGEQSSHFARFEGSGNTPGLAAGAKFTLKNHPRQDQNSDYLVISTRIDMQQGGYESGVPVDTLYSCQVLAQSLAETFRPARLTPKPAVAGPQTAVVVGEGGAGEIVTDKLGRVKVQFHWDRLGKKDSKSSCWIRVASPMAGNGWGFISLPRVGQEVVVDFLDGDPDRPLITGRVHNPEQLPPYELPANATVTTLKSRSKKGAAADFNELRFEDKAGSEYLLMHAQKDRLEFVEDTLKSQIDKAEHRTVKGNRHESVAGEWHVKVTKDVLHKYDAKYGMAVAEDILWKTGGKFSLKVAADIIGKAGATVSLDAGSDMHLKIASNLGADAGMNVHIKGGMNVVIEAGMQVSIKAGGSSVVLGPDGVSITGAMVKLNSGGSPGSGNGAHPEAPTDPADPTEPTAPEDPLSHR
jgi:type VI secretion system secreted protein VgrG